MSLALSPPVFAIVSQLIEEATGLHFRPTDADLLAEKLSLRAAELELDSLLDYYYFLRYDPGGAAELHTLVDTLVVNETYFFREADQLEVFANDLLPELLAARDPARDRLRVWCAACSTGEEPYTLAMLLDERGLLPQVEIVASDISSRALAKAERGVYGGRSFRALSSSQMRARFLSPCLEESSPVKVEAAEVPPRLRGRVSFRRANLFDPAAVSALGTFDAILCRNALIYFRDASIVRLLERFSSSLSARGLLLVGASESLLRFATAFACEERRGAFYYRKVGP